MSKRYYQKELSNSPVYIGGHPVKFDILETEDLTLISELDNCIRRGIGGIIAMSAEEYAVESQKKTSGTSSGSVFSHNPNQQRHSELSAQRQRLAAEGAAANGRHPPSGQFTREGAMPTSGRPIPDPISVPSPNAFSGLFVKPPTAKASEVKAKTKPTP